MMHLDIQRKAKYGLILQRYCLKNSRKKKIFQILCMYTPKSSKVRKNILVV